MKLPDGLPNDHYNRYWEDATKMARELTIKSGTFVNIFCDNDNINKMRHIHFEIGDHSFECLDDVEKAINNKSFL